MKRGGQVIYVGPLGRHSHKLIEYFEVNITCYSLCLGNHLAVYRSNFLKSLSQITIYTKNLVAQ